MVLERRGKNSRKRTLPERSGDRLKVCINNDWTTTTTSANASSWTNSLSKIACVHIMFMAMVMKRSKCLLLLTFTYLLQSSCVPHVTSLRFDYNFSAPGVLAGADFMYMGNSAAASDRIDLTNTSIWSTGRVAYRQPVRLWDDGTGKVASFTSNFTFAVKPLDNTSPGDGMAFFVGPYPPGLPNDAPGGFLGLFNNPNNQENTVFPPTVGVEFDTFRNTWDPNNTFNHLGVDVNNISSTGYTALPDGSFNGTMSAWVRYDANATTLSATLQFDHLPGLPLFNVRANVDLRGAGLPQDAAVGFSAATGDFVERHQILSWSFESILTDDITSKSKKIGLIAGLATAGTFMLLSIAAWLCYLQYQKRHKQEADREAEIPLGEDMDNEFKKGTGPRRFSYSLLSRATRGFSDEEKLGEGGFGAVYRGFLQEQGLHVAVKRVSKKSRQGRREYISEVTIIGRLRHRNLVQLVGWCHEADKLLLVYELMTNGSLDTHLYNPTNILTWPTRYKIILGMGSAVLYLHQEWEQCVVHRDIKPSNVMLDSSFNAKLGDFGLARLIDHSRGAHTTMLAGTQGYMDPECAVSSRASAETDVYSFGVVLLEIACGRKPVDRQEEDESRVLLVQWVWEMYGRDALADAADALLAGEIDAGELERTLVVGLWCVHPDYAFRPSIRQAMNVLQFEAPLPDLPLEMPVAVYAPPPGGYTSSSTGTGSSTSGRTARSSGSSANGRGHGISPFASGDTRIGTRTSASAPTQTEGASNARSVDGGTTQRFESTD